MIRIIRSLLDVRNDAGEPTLTHEEILENFNRVVRINLKSANAQEKEVYDFVLKHLYQWTEAPALKFVQNHFQDKGEPDIAQFVGNIPGIDPLTASSFEATCHQVFRLQQEREATILLGSAQKILTVGLEIREGRQKKTLKGMNDAMEYLYSGVAGLLVSEGGQELAGDSIASGGAVVAHYHAAKADPNKGVGKLSGIEEIDLVCRGGKPGELWTHAAFTGELKTTFALNWAYRTAVFYRHHVIYYSLEMPKLQLDRIIFVMHSGHPKFRAMGFQPLDYRRLRDGELTPKEESFMHIVKEDLIQGAESGEYGMLWIERPVEAVRITDIQRTAEAFHRQHPLGMMVIDRADLIQSRFNVADMTTAQNWVFRDAKQLAMNFAKGEGLFLFLLAQMNREGKKNADQNDGEYRVTDIAYANEAEKSSDVITYTYLAPYMKGEDGVNHWKCGCLKNRDNPIFDTFTGYIDYGSKTMMSMSSVTHVSPETLAQGLSAITSGT